MTYKLPQLPYKYAALEPYIDGQTMEIHYSKHHQGYINKLNNALEGHSDLQEKPLPKLLGDLDAVPEDIRGAVRNNGGGHTNHSLFWQILAPHGEGGGGDPDGVLKEEIEKEFDSIDAFKKEFTNVATSVFGSGWAWLAVTPKGKLHVHGLPNQDNPYMHGDTPIMGLDVWEHAYYLKYQNMRDSYVEAFWNIINWERVLSSLDKAIK